MGLWPAVEPEQSDESQAVRAFSFQAAANLSTLGIDLCPASLKIVAMAFNLLPQNKWLRRFVWLVAGVAALIGLSWTLVPPLLKSQVEKIAGEELGRKVTLGRVDFKPWTLELELGDITVAAANGADGPQLALKRVYLDATAQSLFRLAPVVDAVVVEGLALKVTHLGGGKYDFDDILTRLANRPKNDEKRPYAPPRFALFNLALTGASLDFIDKSVGKTHELRDLNLTVPFLSNLDSQREVKTEPRLAFKFNGSSVDSNAQSTPFHAKPQDRRRHLAQGLRPQTLSGLHACQRPGAPAGVLSADVKVAFEQTSRPSVKLSGVVEAKDVKIADRGGQDLLSFEGLKLALQDVRPLEQSVKLSLVELTSPQVLLARDKARHLNLDFASGQAGAIKTDAIKKEANYADGTRANASNDSSKGEKAATQPWLKSASQPKSPEAASTSRQTASTKAVSSPAASVKAGAARPWAVSVADIALDGGAFQFHDKTTAKPVLLDVSGVKVQVKNFALDAKKPFGLSAFARLKTPQGEPGQLDYKGDLGLSPVSAQGRVVATQIPVHAFEPYFADLVNIEVLRADLGFRGDVRYIGSVGPASGPVVSVKGDSVLEEFKANGVLAGQTISDELLSWKALSVRGLDLAMSPGMATTVSVAETALTDFFARILVNEAGRINLQDVMKSSANTHGDVMAAAPSMTASGAPVATSAAAPSASGPEAVVNIGPISLINGRVYFTDHFVKPNYSANLSELNGRLSAFSSVPGLAPAAGAAGGPAVQMADLELRGRAEGTASLEILGKLNPLAKPLALDIKGKVRDLELPPLSPYSVKYAGHGIERGKLSVDVAYLVLPDGQLTAANNIILNQLKFGDKVEGAPNSLPVQLAVALLADRNGVIDINLPVSGSLNDPQFRLGPIIFKVIINLIVKAITSPFSLLAGAFGGGGDELSMVAFAPGSSALGPEAQTGLDKVAKALGDRPALKLTVVGSANLELEREAYKRERFKAMLQAEKRRAAVVGGLSSLAGAPTAPTSAASAASAVPPATVLSEAETPALLKEVYKRADFPKPRNLIGMAKDIPDAEMEALILANIVVTEDVMRELALQRGVAVKDYLAGKQLPLERLFLGAVKAGDAQGKAVVTADAKADARADVKADAKADAKWTPRAELNLQTN